MTTPSRLEIGRARRQVNAATARQRRGRIALMSVFPVLAVVLAVVGLNLEREPDAPSPVAASSTTPPTTAPAPTTTVSPEVSAATTRLAFLQLAARDAGYAEFYVLDENVGALASQTCATIAADPTSDGVWEAAADLENGPFAFTTDAAWGAVSLFATVNCADQGPVVAATIADVTG